MTTEEIILLIANFRLDAMLINIQVRKQLSKKKQLYFSTAFWNVRLWNYSKVENISLMFFL